MQLFSAWTHHINYCVARAFKSHSTLKIVSPLFYPSSSYTYVFPLSFLSLFILRNPVYIGFSHSHRLSRFIYFLSVCVLVRERFLFHLLLTILSLLLFSPSLLFTLFFLLVPLSSDMNLSSLTWPGYWISLKTWHLSKCPVTSTCKQTRLGLISLSNSGQLSSGTNECSRRPHFRRWK